MEKIRKEEFERKNPISEFDEKLLAKFIAEIKSFEEIAQERVEEEWDLIVSKLSLTPSDPNKIHELIIKWKVNYYNCLKSEFFFIKNLSNHYLFMSFKGGENEKMAKVALDFYSKYKQVAFYSQNEFVEKFCNEAFEFFKAERFYNLANVLISIINNKLDTTLKLPLIENFEVDTFYALSKENKKLIEEYEKENKNILKLKYELIENKSEIRTLKRDNISMQNKITGSENYIEIIQNEIAKKDYTPVGQFNKLYWGDNYPSLKALFDYLQKNRIVQENWSYFASLMSIQNLEPINLNTGILGKKEIGYLLEKIKPFFLSDYKNRKNRYLSVLNRKFRIDFEPIDSNFQKNYIRDYKKANDRLKIMDEIDNLCSIIADRYF